MFYGLTFAIGAISPMFWLISVEVWAVFVGLTTPHPWWAAALAAASGQVVCFSAAYLLGGRYLRRVPWIQRKLAFFEPGRYQRHAKWFYATAAFLGFPPLILMSMVAPLMEVRYPLFFAIVATGRLARLSLLVAFAQKAQEWVPVERLPEWLRAWA